VPHPPPPPFPPPQLALPRQTTCKACSGSGGADGAKEVECKDCRGQGVRTVLRQLAPGMVQQMQMPCAACRGAGSSMPEGKKCKPCDGKKVVAERKVLEVLITKGCVSGTKVVMRGEAGDAPGVEAGDVIFVIKVEEHTRFQRVHHHLLIEKDVPLVDALTGASFSVTHLDGRRLHVTSKPGDVIQPGSYMCIANAGMPLASNHYRFGDLLVRFNVIFPPSGSLAAAAPALKKLLPRDMDAGARKDAAVKRRAAFKARASGREEAEEDEGDAPLYDDDGAGAGAAGKAAARGEHDEDVALAPCNINVKIQEAQAQQSDDKRSGQSAYDEDEVRAARRARAQMQARAQHICPHARPRPRAMTSHGPCLPIFFLPPYPFRTAAAAAAAAACSARSNSRGRGAARAASRRWSRGGAPVGTPFFTCETGQKGCPRASPRPRMARGR
jgi:DnaJ-class molecular chaperone